MNRELVKIQTRKQIIKVVIQVFLNTKRLMVNLVELKKVFVKLLAQCIAEFVVIINLANINRIVSFL